MAVPPLPRMLRNKKPPAARPMVVTVSVHCAPKARLSRIVHPWRRRSARPAGVYVHCPRSSAHHPLPCQKGLPALARSPPGDRRIRAPLPLWLSFGSTQRGVSDPAAAGEALIRPLLSRPLASLDVSGQRRLFTCTPRLTRCECRSRRQHMPSTSENPRAIWTNAKGSRHHLIRLAEAGERPRPPSIRLAGVGPDPPSRHPKVPVAALRSAARWVGPGPYAEDSCGAPLSVAIYAHVRISTC